MIHFTHSPPPFLFENYSAKSTQIWARCLSSFYKVLFFNSISFNLCSVPYTLKSRPLLLKGSQPGGGKRNICIYILTVMGGIVETEYKTVETKKRVWSTGAINVNLHREGGVC